MSKTGSALNGIKRVISPRCRARYCSENRRTRPGLIGNLILCVRGWRVRGWGGYSYYPNATNLVLRTERITPKSDGSFTLHTRAAPEEPES